MYFIALLGAILFFQSTAKYIVEIVENPERLISANASTNHTSSHSGPIIGFLSKYNNSAFEQSFNPSWIERCTGQNCATPSVEGLLVRGQNCSAPPGVEAHCQYAPHDTGNGAPSIMAFLRRTGGSDELPTFEYMDNSTVVFGL